LHEQPNVAFAYSAISKEQNIIYRNSYIEVNGDWLSFFVYMYDSGSRKFMGGAVSGAVKRRLWSCKNVPGFNAPSATWSTSSYSLSIEISDMEFNERRNAVKAR